MLRAEPHDPGAAPAKPIYAVRDFLEYASRSREPVQRPTCDTEAECLLAGNEAPLLFGHLGEPAQR